MSKNSKGQTSLLCASETKLFTLEVENPVVLFCFDVLEY